jgi:hypothetical protein
MLANSSTESFHEHYMDITTPAQAKVRFELRFGVSRAKCPPFLLGSPQALPLSQSMIRTTFIAVAFKVCWRWVRANPIWVSYAWGQPGDAYNSL